MKITRQNYEHWFIDFIEGNLNPADEAMLRKFVQLNPDLNSELEDIAEFTIVPVPNKYEQKELLKQNLLKAIDEITKFEQLSIAYLENDLDENEQAELDQLVQNSAKNNKEFQLLQKTRLLAETNIGYKKKDSLKKLFVVPARAFNYKLFYRVAAVFVLLISLTIIFNQNFKKELVGKQLSRLDAMQTSRKVLLGQTEKIAVADDNEQAFVLQNLVFQEETRQANSIPEQMVARKCVSINYERADTGYLVDNINNSISETVNSPVKLKPAFGKSLLYVANVRRKAIGTKISAALKRNFRYKKINTDDGRTLIALKAGDMEYIVSRKQKNK